jgi:ribulose-phosphate 3-epimerase
MAATVCPTILADNPEDYRTQMERVEAFAERIHVDVMDGNFAQPCGIGLDEIWWRGNRTVDVHIMYRRPAEHLDVILALKPRLVIVHAEAEGDFFAFSKSLHAHGIEAGVALLPQTPVKLIAGAMESIDHVLVFSGHLGHFGGSANLSLLEKIKAIRELKPTVEIGWDGGVNDQNARQLAEGGVDVLNVGGFIQHAEDPIHAYATLKAVV